MNRQGDSCSTWGRRFRVDWATGVIGCATGFISGLCEKEKSTKNKTAWLFEINKLPNPTLSLCCSVKTDELKMKYDNGFLIVASHYLPEDKHRIDSRR